MTANRANRARLRRAADDPGSLVKRLGVLYARVSSREQAEGFSLPAQLKLLREYADRIDITIVAEFVEAESAKRAGRTEFRKMMDYLRSHPEVRIILFEKTDRMSRNLRDAADLDVDQTGLELHLVKENEVLSRRSRSHEKFVHGIKVLMAKNYVDNLSEEVIKGQTEKASEGLWPSAAPIGYRNVLEDHTIEPHPDEAPLVCKAFELAVSGSETLLDISRKLYALGLRSRRAGKRLGKEALRRIFTNPIYYGDFEWKGVVYKGTHKPIISRELFEQVQEALSKRTKPRKRKNEFAFTGLIECASCGAAITAQPQEGAVCLLPLLREVRRRRLPHRTGGESSAR